MGTGLTNGVGAQGIDCAPTGPRSADLVVNVIFLRQPLVEFAAMHSSIIEGVSIYGISICSHAYRALRYAWRNDCRVLRHDGADPLWRWLCGSLWALW